VLLNYLIYFHDLNHFAALERMNHDDTRATIQSIIKLAKSEPDDPFHAIWEATQNAPPDAAFAVDPMQEKFTATDHRTSLMCCPTNN
jgi:hypothetical protein